MAEIEIMNERDFNDQVQRAANEVYALCTPALMPRQQAIEFLNEVISVLQMTSDALEEEVDDATKNDC